MRARNIKPSFFKNPDLGGCSHHARLAFIGLWCMADREGRVLDRAKLVKAELFPYDNIDVEPLLCELAQANLIKRYEVDGQKIIWIVTFAKHQSPHVKEKPSELPAFSQCLVQAPDKHQTSTNPGQCQHPLNPESGYLNPECGIRIPESGYREARENPGAAVAAPPSPDQSIFSEVLSEWNETMAGNCRMTSQRRTSIRERMKDPWWRENWRKAIRACRQSPFCQGVNDRGWVADLDWFLKPETANKLIEGKYDSGRMKVSVKMASTLAGLGEWANGN